MSVLVKGMKMPSECARFEDGEFVHCLFVNTDDDCILQSKVTGTWEEMYQNCPLVALPDKHGRLGDLDALIEKYWDGNSMTITGWDLKDIKVVIEAEDE